MAGRNARSERELSAWRGALSTVEKFS